MPRNSSGTYTLPAGNPVVTGTTISSAWANSTLSDLGTALTDSLSRSGDGAMLAPLEAFAGTIGAPGLSWGAETTSGFYRAGIGDFRFAIAGVDVWTIGSGGASSTRYLAGDGTALLPAFSFTLDPDTGIYRVGANTLGFATGGVEQLEILSNSIIARGSNTQFLATVADSTAAPGFSWDGDPNTGFRRLGADNIGVVVGANVVMDIQNVAIGIPRPIYSLDGTAGAPSYSFATDTDLGMYSGGVGFINFSVGGVDRFIVSAGANYSRVRILNADGTTGAPSITFESDLDTGIHLQGADNMRITAGGVDVWGFGTVAGTPLNQPFGAIQGVIDGTAATPLYSFNNDPDTGVYRSGTNSLGFSSAGVRVAETTPGQFGVVDGSAASPAMTFITDPDTGIYRFGANQIGFAAGGVVSAVIRTTDLSMLVPIVVQDGTVGAPSYSFANQSNTGLYRIGASSIGMSLGGVLLAGFGITLGAGIGSISGAAASTSSYAGNFLGAGTATSSGSNSNVRLVASGAARATGIVFTDGSVWNSWIEAQGDGSLTFGVSGTGVYSERLKIDTVGRINGNALHNNASGIAGATQYIGSGTYTPTLTASVNVSASTSAVCQYIRVGSVVSVSGVVLVTPTSGVGALTTLGISLPIASNLATVTQCGGSGAHNSSPVGIYGNTGSDRADADWFSSTAGSVELRFHFQYLVV